MKAGLAMPARHSRHLGSRRRDLARRGLGVRGVAAVEFAIIMPILLVLFLGTIEILTLYRTEAKLNAVASNVAQMVAIQPASVVLTTGTPETGTSLNDICQGAVSGLQPFPATGLTLAIASVTLESGPSGLPTTSGAHSTTAAYDSWEADSTVSRGSCSTAAGSAIGLANAVAVTGSGNTAMLSVPCDNAIMVRASIVYPGLTGLVLNNRPTLTQTAYARWVYASTTNEVVCASCTVSNTTRVCKTGNTATN